MSGKTEQLNKAEAPKKGRWLIEYGPLILFFVVNYAAGILFATAVLVAATIIALGISWALDRLSLIHI